MPIKLERVKVKVLKGDEQEFVYSIHAKVNDRYFVKMGRGSTVAEARAAAADRLRTDAVLLNKGPLDDATERQIQELGAGFTEPER